MPDEEQVGGVTTHAPAVLLHSGPGTGKSRVLSARLAYILQSNWMTPEQIVTLSFTNRDARVIKEKAVAMMRRSGYFDEDSESTSSSSSSSTIQERVEVYKKRLWAGTFHSFSSAIIRRYGDDMLRDLRVVSSTEQRAMLSEIVSRILSKKHFKSFTQPNQDNEPIDESIAEALTLAKEELGSLGSLVYAISRCLTYWKEANIPINTSTLSTSRPVPMVPKSAALAATYVYPLYREYQKEGKTIDASDLTGLAINLLLGNQNALVELRGRLGQMVVDEFQDVSASQHELLKLVINGVPNVGVKGFDVPKLFCAGDVDQCIYGWRGSTPSQNIGQFLEDFPQGVVVPCRTNYRLPRSIMNAANHLMGKVEEERKVEGEKGIFPATNGNEEAARRDHMGSQKAYDVSPAAMVSLKRLLPNPSDSLGNDFADSSTNDKVLVRGFWDDKQEAKSLATMINKRYNERKKLLGEGKRNYFDTSEVAVMVRSADQMTVIAETFANTRIPFVAEGYAASSRVNAAPNRAKAGEMAPSKASESVLDNPRSKKIVQILGGCSDGFLIEDNDFVVVVEHFGGYNEDLGRSDKQLSLYENAERIWAEGSERVAEAVAKSLKFVQKWNEIFVSSEYIQGTPKSRQALLIQCLQQVPAFAKGERETTSSKRAEREMQELCSMVAETERIGRFILQEAVGDLSNDEGGQQQEDRRRQDLPQLAAGAGKTPSMAPVRLITMHRAKGNEFDDIYCAGWEEGVFPSKGAIVNEERRLAFVALTRARQRVVITYAGRRRTADSAGQVIQHLPSRFLSELRSSADETIRGPDPGQGNGGLFKGMAPQVGSQWIERWGDGGKSKRGGTAEKRALKTQQVREEGWGARDRGEEEETVVEEETTTEEESIKVAVKKTPKVAKVNIKKKATMTKTKVKKFVGTEGKVEKILDSLDRKEIKAKDAMVLFKSMVKKKGIKAGAANVTDTDGNTKRKPLSKCTARELGLFLLQMGV
ncbi:hypothetical protein TL16_g05394 [Triparma laevis f. inornata]|uniref:DNA 3'-5' helicase n=1 Tax=Triparma laevis f. inornata TaxID=1714386 RepID=A0A9W7E910_9STRA|nr:hypothetical protein TL16_g05394 [Triparma laevis f. inornata]